MKLLSKVLALLLLLNVATYAHSEPSPSGHKPIVEESKTPTQDVKEWNVHISGSHIMIFALTFSGEALLSHIFTSGYSEMLFRSFVVYPGFYAFLMSDTFQKLRDTFGPMANKAYDVTMGPTVDHGINRVLNFGSSSLAFVKTKLPNFDEQSPAKQ